MTIQQLRYADGIARFGSFNEAARRLFVTQPTLTASIQALEEEIRTAIFARGGKGVTVTREGEEFLSHARQVLDDVDRIGEKYSGKPVRLPQFAVSCQHYAFAVEAFTEVVKECTAAEYDFTLRETVTSEVIDDVASRKSEAGVLYLSKRNSEALAKIFRRNELVFEELYASQPHVFLGKRHPLAKAKRIRPQQLDEYPYISYEQGEHNALYFSEEIMPAIDRKKNIRVRDRGTMTNLILELNGYTVASSGLSKKLNGPEIVKIPLALNDTIRVGLLRRKEGLSPAGAKFAAAIRALVQAAGLAARDAAKDYR
ncbi:MAG: LysR family transcriptional regulator [Kiritimatiellae bacterium]|nr:LysR family transcriptional regulator [Kiritimatiellia bacterium]